MQLVQELRDSLVETDYGVWIQHCFIHMPYDPRLNKHYNNILTWKRNLSRDYTHKKNWSDYIFLCERPYRVNIFNTISDRLTDSEYWSLLKDIWSDCENIFQNQELWRSLFKVPRQHKDLFMSAAERCIFNELSDRFIIYRGYHPKHRNKRGMSYTLDKQQALWFANRFEVVHGSGKVTRRIVNKEEIFAYIDDRKEKEIIVL